MSQALQTAFAANPAVPQAPVAPVESAAEQQQAAPEPQVEATQQVEQTTESAAERQEVATQQQEDSFPSLLKERTGGKFENVDSILKMQEEYSSYRTQMQEMQAKMEELQNRKHEYAHPFAEKFDEYIRNGGDNPDGFIKASRIDVEKLSPRDAVAMKMRMDHPGLSDRQIELKLNRKYPQLDEAMRDEYTDEQLEDFELAEADLMMDSKAAKEYLAKYKVDMSTPTQQRQAEVDQQVLAQQKAWNDEVAKSGAEFSKIGLKYGKEGELDLPLDQDLAKAAVEMSKIENLGKMVSAPGMLTKDGTVDPQKLFTIMAIARQGPDVFLKNVANSIEAQVIERMTDKARGKGDLNEVTASPAQASEADALAIGMAKLMGKHK